MVFIGFSLVVLLFMHLTMQNLSRVKSSCLVGHEKTLSNLEEFRDSLLESDLLVSFVDKTDLARLERERREAEIRVTKLIRQLKTVQAELVSDVVFLFLSVCVLHWTILDSLEDDNNEW